MARNSENIKPSGETINLNNMPEILMVVIVGFIVVIIILFTFSDCFYQVEQDEHSIVLRFGQKHAIEGPGLHFKFPYVDRVILVQTGRVMKEEFGYRSQGNYDGRSNYSKKGFNNESLCLTGDLNVCDVEWTVQYKIDDPYKYLFSVRNPQKAIRDVSEASTRKVLGKANVTDILTTERPALAAAILEDMQNALKIYDMGVRIESYNFQDVNPPEAVKPAYNSVNQAEQQKESAIQNAQQLYNQSIPKAKGEASEKISIAEGYKLERINKAKGEVQAFLAVLSEYKKSPEVTKQRLYIETMEKILPKAQELYILDGKNNGNNVLPLLNLNEN